MAGTHYGALNFTLEEEKKPQGALRKSGAVAAVVVAVCVMFFAGRVHKSVTTPFTHDEVMNVASTCPRNQFIGKCTDCKKCQPYEYNNGGCSWFKDTFCSYCDPIPHCNRIHQRCQADAVTQKQGVNKCLECDCIKAPNAYGQKTLEDIEYYRRTWKVAKQTLYTQKSMQYSCFFNGGQPWSPKAKNDNAHVPDTECRACTVCPKQYYQPADGKCDPANHKDTVCKRCTVCQDFQYTSQICTYFTDTVCDKCANCRTESATNKDNVAKYESSPCSGKTLNKNVYEVGTPGTCSDCSTAPAFADKWFVKKECKPGNYEEKCDENNPDVCGPIYKGGARNTEFAKCSGCKAGQYIDSPCDKGISGRRGEAKTCKAETFNCGAFRKGADDVCKACKVNRGCDAKNGGEDCKSGRFLDKTGAQDVQLKNFRTRVCDNTKDFNGDATYGNCNKCEIWEFAERQCAAECRKTEDAGKCQGKSYPTPTTACTKDSDCTAGGKKGYCGGMCNLKGLKDGKEVVGSSEDGNMANGNKLGTQSSCSSCPNVFVAGMTADDKPSTAPSAGLKSRCPLKYKTCKYAPQGPRFNADGMVNQPAYSTCDGACPFSAEGHTALEQAYFKKQKANFDNCCLKGALGPSCEWSRYNKQCRTPFKKNGVMQGMPYRKRTKKTGGYSGFRPKGLTKEGTRKPKLADDGTMETSHIFVRWCKQLCDDFPSCTMFQVARCLVDGTCAVKDGSLCDLYKGDSSENHIMNEDKPDALSDEELKEIKKASPSDWTCEQGAAIFAKHRGYTAEWANAGFECTGADKRGVKTFVWEGVAPNRKKKPFKCGTEMCRGAEAKCCEQNKNVCYSKPAASISLQQSRR